MRKKHKTLKIVFIALLSFMAVLSGGFLIWANDYYHADDIAIEMMQGDPSIEVIDRLTIVSPDKPSDTGIIFYPGAKVEATAYIPLLEKLKKEGYTCVLVKMPLNMAIFDVNAADQVFEYIPEVENWYIMGHSMGGAMASDYASNHQDKVDGLILLGAYIYGEYPPEKTLTVYGTFNSNLEKYIDYVENIVKIEGGNHAQFGNYGKQKGDPDATISAEEQQTISVNAIVKFIESRRTGQ
jgi:hypothetical protein